MDEKLEYYFHIAKEQEKKIIAKCNKKWVILTDLATIKDSFAKTWDVYTGHINISARTSYQLGNENPTQEQLQQALEDLSQQNESCSLVFNTNDNEHFAQIDVSLKSLLRKLTEDENYKDKVLEGRISATQNPDEMPENIINIDFNRYNLPLVFQYNKLIQTKDENPEVSEIFDAINNADNCHEEELED